jgi:putative serine protease PepD
MGRINFESKGRSMRTTRFARGRTVAATALAVSALAGAGVGVGTYAALNRSGGTTTVRQVAAPSPSSQQVSSASTLSVAEIYRRASRGVVEISVTTSGSGGTSTFPFGQGGTQSAQGSGFVYDTAGHVITNDHVVDGADTISVRFSGGATYKATVVGTDPSTDLAVLKIDAPSSVLHPLTLGDSGALQVGDGVVAIGSPFGLEETVTSGIVSALHREITSPNHFAIEDAIQTDAAINHGNSGGPLLNLQGQVIGVNAQIQSEGGGNDGVGFAVPSDTVSTIVGKLLANGKVEHAYLGVGIQTIPKAFADQLGGAAGAAVTDVKTGTPAQKAGLRKATGQKTIQGVPYATGGDVITKIDGTSIATDDALRRAVDAHQPGDKVTLTFVRNGKTQTATITLGTRPST